MVITPFMGHGILPRIVEKNQSRGRSLGYLFSLDKG